MKKTGTLLQKDYKEAMHNPQGILRRCSGAPRLKDNDLELWDKKNMGIYYCGYTYFAMYNKVVYQKFIFFFSLQSKMISKYSCNGRVWPDRFTYNDATLKLIGNAKYIKVNNCNYEWNKNHNSDGCNLGYGTWEKDWRGYRGSRALNKYDFSVNFYIKHFSVANPVCLPKDFYTSRLYHIQAGY